MTQLLQIGGGLLRSVSQAAVIAGTLVLVLMLVALGTYAYKQLRGGGVEWPDDKADGPDETDEGLRQGGDDDEWKYY